MNPGFNDEIYVEWMSKWRLWKKAWCESDESVVQFYLKFIGKQGKYSPADHADFSASVVRFLGPSRIDKKGVIEVGNGAVVRPTISVIESGSTNTVYQDRLGIVTLKLSFFSRKDILKIALALEMLGHGVLHDNGRVVSSSYANEEKPPRKMPFRDDPVWSIVQ
ncbi:unnamed protein product, partial [Sphacelaria rigidula]